MNWLAAVKRIIRYLLTIQERHGRSVQVYGLNMRPDMARGLEVLWMHHLLENGVVLAVKKPHQYCLELDASLSVQTSQ
eukprot:9340204-Ditylum_brightwellii.AAC.1